MARKLVMDTEVAISKLAIQDQDAYRVLAKHNIENIMNRTKMHAKHQNQDLSSLKATRHKIKQHKSVITQADKGKTVVIIRRTQ